MTEQSKYVGYWSYNHDDNSPESSFYVWKSKRPNLLHRMMNMILLGNVWFDATPKPYKPSELPVELEFKPICPDCVDCNEVQEKESDGYIVRDTNGETQAVFKVKDPWQ